MISKISLIVWFTVLGTACSSKESKETVAASTETTPSVTPSDSSTVSFAGQLNLAIGLIAETKGILAFKLVGGTASGLPQEVTVDADGKFTVDIDKDQDDVDKAIAEIGKGFGAFDIEVLAPLLHTIFSYPEAGIREALLEAESVKYLTISLKGIKEAGTVTMLVAYEKSGDKVAEAQSFRFIGLPTASGKNLSAIDTQAILGDLNLGKISDATGDDAVSELSSAEALSISAEAQDSLADAGKALKSIRNAYMNSSWETQPFYLWRHKSGVASIVNTFSVPGASFYNGTGFYVKSLTDTPFVFTDICGASKKLVAFTPPRDVVSAMRDITGAIQNQDTLSVFDNATVSEATQDDRRVCQGGTFYAREDATKEYMLNFGTGGSIQGAIPEGLWKLKYDGTEYGRFDLAAGGPIDANGNPTVFVPSIKIISEGGKYTGAVVDLYLWSGTAFVKMSDLSSAAKLMSQMTVSLSGGSNEGRNDTSFNAGKTQLLSTFEEPVTVSEITSIAFSYQIGAASYRWEYRD